MKVDLQAAVKELADSDFVAAGDHMIVKVSLVKNLYSEDESLKWELYAYSSKEKNKSAWSADGKSFDDALESLREKLKPSQRFVE